MTATSTPVPYDERAPSPKTLARIAGFLYLIVIAGGIFAQLGVRDGLLVAGDAVATARNIQNNTMLWRQGFAVEVFYLLCNIPLTFLLYRLFGVVNRHVALVMLLFAGVGTAVEGASLVAHYAPLLILGKGTWLAAFTPEQLAAAAFLSLRFFDYGFMIALTFFGGFCLCASYLIWKSAFFPRFVAPLLAFEGVAYLLNSFAHFISPPFGAKIFPFLLVAGLAEISFCLTLLIAGVNAARWLEQKLRAH
jgi:hypothetical protein